MTELSICSYLGGETQCLKKGLKGHPLFLGRLDLILNLTKSDSQYLSDVSVQRSGRILQHGERMVKHCKVKRLRPPPHIRAAGAVIGGERPVPLSGRFGCSYCCGGDLPFLQVNWNDKFYPFGNLRMGRQRMRGIEAA